MRTRIKFIRTRSRPTCRRGWRVAAPRAAAAAEGERAPPSEPPRGKRGRGGAVVWREPPESPQRGGRVVSLEAWVPPSLSMHRLTLRPSLRRSRTSLTPLLSMKLLDAQCTTPAPALCRMGTWEREERGVGRGAAMGPRRGTEPIVERQVFAHLRRRAAAWEEKRGASGRSMKGRKK